MADFNIIEFISGLTGYVFDRTVIERIALTRGVAGATAYTDLTRKDIDLLTADLLYTAYCSPNTMASMTNTHGSYTKSIGHQVVTDRDRLYNTFMAIYRRYGDPMAEGAEAAQLQWLDI